MTIIFDSDEQRKAVFASIYSKKEFRGNYRKSKGFKPKIQNLDSQIKALRRIRGSLKRDIDMAKRRHHPLKAVGIKLDKLAEIDNKIQTLESEKRRLQQY